MPMRDEISLRPLGKDGKLPVEFDWSWTSTLARNPDFVPVCGFSLIGLFTWLILAMQFPFSDEMVALLAQF
jgi:hypothetical protein